MKAKNSTNRCYEYYIMMPRKLGTYLRNLLKIRSWRGRRSNLYSYLLSMINKIRVSKGRMIYSRPIRTRRDSRRSQQLYDPDIDLLMKHIKIYSGRAYFTKCLTFKNLPIRPDVVNLMNDNSANRSLIECSNKKFTYVDTISVSKQTNNDHFVKIIRKYLAKAKNILLLDGPMMFSTKTIVESKLKYDNIIIVESDYATYQKHCMSKYCISKQCIAFHDRLEDFTIRDSNNELLFKLNCIYLDFTGTVEGRYCGPRKYRFYPLEILHNILEKTSSKKIVLCLTFALRSHRGIFGNHECLADQIENDFVIPCVKYSRFCVDYSFRRSYNRRDSDDNSGACQQMLFICLVLQKDESIDITKIKFVTEEIILDGNPKKIYLGYDPYKWIVN